jgi:hypothetical protein
MSYVKKAVVTTRDLRGIIFAAYIIRQVFPETIIFLKKEEKALSLEKYDCIYAPSFLFECKSMQNALLEMSPVYITSAEMQRDVIIGLHLYKRAPHSVSFFDTTRKVDELIKVLTRKRGKAVKIIREHIAEKDDDVRYNDAVGVAFNALYGKEGALALS